MVAEGPKDAILALEEWCQTGPELAQVQDVQSTWEEPVGMENELMFAPVFRMGSFAHLAFMALGCSTDGETFGRLVETWVDETVTLSQPALTDALVVAGMAAEICALGDDLDWSSMELGDAIPLSDSINSSLGLPVLSELEDYGDGTVQVILSGIVMMDRDESLLRFTTAKVDDELL